LNTTGFQDTASGHLALSSITIGSANTADGVAALSSNTQGSCNTACGVQALFLNTTGNQNTAVGLNALVSNTTGDKNTAVGIGPLGGNTTGSDNTAVGVVALFNNETGNTNVAIGESVLTANTTGSGNIGLGYFAGDNVTTANSVICIGASGENVDNTCFIGNIYAAATISGTTRPVIVSDDGQLGTASSSARFKTETKPMDSASEVILGLEPVTFHYKDDTKDTPQFGLIAEEVAHVNPGLVVCDKEGKPYTVRYDAVNAMLLNEFLKEHRKNEQQEATIARLQQQIEALTAGLQKVSAQLELTKAASQTVLNNQ
jgi:hypothetical protein